MTNFGRTDTTVICVACLLTSWLPRLHLQTFRQEEVAHKEPSVTAFQEELMELVLSERFTFLEYLPWGLEGLQAACSWRRWRHAAVNRMGG